MDIYKTRKANLRLLIDKWGGVTSLAKKLGHNNPSYLSQLTGPRSSRDISERAARKIEEALDLKLGWLDADHQSATFTQEKSPPPDINPDKLAECIEIVTRLCDANSVRPTPGKFADLVSIAYQESRADREAYLTRIIKLMRQ
jgi:hypothetical protein